MTSQPPEGSDPPTTRALVRSPELDFLFSYTADLEDPQQLVGAGPSGMRMIAKVIGGRVSGPRLTGCVLPCGGA